ncbi:hypothetical protein JKF63_07686 [Porcisia hertigi]|uniref:Uncharacterized protein n=1 Tax=Porcisia hertigi TaxID=2761500 RepID=A0A836I2V7_9TRYP|nr:hypothetical protein JKF63_07686 [Porcisia hertigi]
MRAIQVILPLIALLLVSLLANADVVLQSCTTTQDIIDAVTDGNSSHYLLFYDSLDVNSVRVYNTLSVLKTKRTFKIDVFDIREPQSSWLRSSLDIVYAPALIYIKWTANRRKVIDAYSSMDFGSAALAQFLQRH